MRTFDHIVIGHGLAGAAVAWCLGLRDRRTLIIDSGTITASWVAQGRFSSGQVHSGNRMLVYSGPISTPFMEDVLKFQFNVDGTLIRRAVPVSFHFEMDED